MSTLRTLIRVDIQIDQEWAVGAAPELWFRPDAADIEEDSRTIRQQIQRDPSGAFLLPATSLVGSLRGHLGFVDGNRWLGSSQGDDTIPSALRCLGATIHAPEARTLTSTAIEPKRRAAQGGYLRAEEVLKPALVTWWVEWDHHNPDLNLDELVRQLRQWRPVIGRRRSANRGRAHVDAVHHRTIDLATEEGLSWWLAERTVLCWTSLALGQGWITESGTTADEGRVLLRQTFRVVDALHIGGLPLSSEDGVKNLNRTRDVLPSTSWRGVFRHRVEHIVRVSTSGSQKEVDKRVAAVSARLFGSGREPGASEEAGHRGQLRFGDSTVQGARARRTHVAIDRVSGGAARATAEDPKDDSGLLFEVEYFKPGSALDLVILNDSFDPVSQADRGLLDAVIKDLDDGLIGVGGMTTRGYGTLQSVEGQR